MKIDCCLISKKSLKLYRRGKVEEPDKEVSLEEIIKQTKKFVIIVEEESNGITAEFETKIKKIVEEVKRSRGKRIFYTSEEGNLHSDNLDKIEELLEEVPSRKKQFLKEYSLNKIVRYVSKKKLKIKLSLSFAFELFSIKKLSDICDFLKEILSELGSNTEEIVSSVAKISGFSYTSSWIFAGSIVVVGTGVVYVVLGYWERISSQPLFVYNLKKWYGYFVALCIAMLVSGVSVYKQCDNNVCNEMKIDFYRESIVDITDSNDTIFVPINETLKPIGYIEIKDNESPIYSSECDDGTMWIGDFMKDCPVLTDGEEYEMDVHLNLFEEELGSDFTYCEGETVKVFLKPREQFTSYETIDKLTVCAILAECGFDKVDNLSLYATGYEEHKVTFELDDFDESDSLFTIDIGFIYLIVNDGSHQKVVEFVDNGSLSWNIYEDFDLPKGYATVELCIEE